LLDHVIEHRLAHGLIRSEIPPWCEFDHEHGFVLVYLELPHPDESEPNDLLDEPVHIQAILQVGVYRVAYQVVHHKLEQVIQSGETEFAYV